MLLFNLLKVNICNETRNKLKFTRTLCVLTMWDVNPALASDWKQARTYTPLQLFTVPDSSEMGTVIALNLLITSLKWCTMMYV